jgi:hypothetical protein
MTSVTSSVAFRKQDDRVMVRDFAEHKHYVILTYSTVVADSSTIKLTIPMVAET